MVHLREKYSALFSAHIIMRQLMQSPDMLQLARRVVECLKLFKAWPYTPHPTSHRASLHTAQKSPRSLFV